MEQKQSLEHPAKALERIRRLAAMSDPEFSQAFLEELSEAELAEFERECPEFPRPYLPRKST